MLPILTYPYLLKTLGIYNWGIIVFAQTITSYFAILVNFGFNITGARRISQQANNQHNKTVTIVYATKGIFLIFSLIILFVIVLSNRSQLNILILLSSWNILYEFGFPIWYFQGINKLKYISILNVIFKLLVTCLIFLFINSELDIYIYPILNLIGVFVLVGCSFIVLKKEKISLVRINIEDISSIIKESYIMALAYASNTVRSSINVLVIKFILSYKEVTYFDIAIKIINILTTLLDQINQALFPLMLIEKNMKFLVRIIFITLLFTIIVSTFIIVFAENILFLINGTLEMNAIRCLQILSIILPLYIVGALLGRNCLLIFSRDQDILKSMILSFVIHLALVAYFAITVTDRILELICMSFVFSLLVESLYRLRKSQPYLTLK